MIEMLDDRDADDDDNDIDDVGDNNGIDYIYAYDDELPLIAKLYNIIKHSLSFTEIKFC